MVLEFEQDSWTEVVAPTVRRSSPGSSRRGTRSAFEARDGFRLTLGNAGGVRVTVDGRAARAARRRRTGRPQPSRAGAPDAELVARSSLPWPIPRARHRSSPRTWSRCVRSADAAAGAARCSRPAGLLPLERDDRLRALLAVAGRPGPGRSAPPAAETLAGVPSGRPGAVPGRRRPDRDRARRRQPAQRRPLRARAGHPQPRGRRRRRCCALAVDGHGRARRRP